MASKVVIVIGLVALAAAGAYVVSQNQPQPPARKAFPGPPSGAEFTDDDPRTILAVGATAARRGAGPKTASSDDYIGLWNREPGWEGEVVDITSERQGPAIRMEVRDSGVVGGSYFIIAIVGEDHGVSKGEIARVQGRISDVRTIVAAAQATHRIVLDPARVLDHHKP
jgi:hypothetical protein